MRTRSAIRLALPRHAQAIARLSREHVEYGLVWRYTPARIGALMRATEVNVAVVESATDADDPGHLAGFGIMEYRRDDAHLVLLAVDPRDRRRGLGRSLVEWLEAVAVTAGLARVSVESRISNHAARRLYAGLGYREQATLARYYDDIEDGVRLVKRLHTGR